MPKMDSTRLDSLWSTRFVLVLDPDLLLQADWRAHFQDQISYVLTNERNLYT